MAAETFWNHFEILKAVLDDDQTKHGTFELRLKHESTNKGMFDKSQEL